MSKSFIPNKTAEVLAKISYYLAASLIAIYFVGLIIKFISSLSNVEVDQLSATWLFYFPLGVFFVLSFKSVFRRYATAKLHSFSSAIYEANKLIEIPGKLGEFDVALTNNPQFVWRGIEVPFLIATARLLNDARMGFMSEFHRPNVREGVRRNLKSLEEGVREADYIQSFESLGEMLVYPIEENTHKKRIESSVLAKTFVFHCYYISKLLEKKRLVDADRASQDLIESLAIYKSKGSQNLNWQALISRWIYVKISLLQDPHEIKPSGAFLGPSKVFARELKLAMDNYRLNNWKGVCDIINDSFIWRKWTPKILFR